MVGGRTRATKAGKERRVVLEAGGERGAWVILKVPFVPSGDGTHFMMVDKAMQKGAGVGAGDRVRLTLAADAAPRVVAVPADLARALAGRRSVKARFAALSPSHKREYIGHVDEAKKPETRARRIAWTIATLERQD